MIGIFATNIRKIVADAADRAAEDANLDLLGGPGTSERIDRAKHITHQLLAAGVPLTDAMSVAASLSALLNWEATTSICINLLARGRLTPVEVIALAEALEAHP